MIDNIGALRILGVVARCVFVGTMMLRVVTIYVCAGI